MEYLEIGDVEVDATTTDLNFVPHAVGLSMGVTNQPGVIAVILRDEDRTPIAYTLATPETIRTLLNRCLEIQ